MTDTQEAPVVEEKEKSLDDYLAEFDAQTQPEPQPTEGEQVPEWKHLENTVNDLQQQQYRRGIDESIGKMKAVSEISHVGNTAIEGYLEQRARLDPRITQAFMQKDRNPVAWDQILKTLAKDYQNEIRQPDAQVTEDQKAMRAAVESQPDTGEPIEKSVRDLNTMNDAEFAKYKASLM